MQSPSRPFFESSGRYFFRFLRLAFLSGGLYAVVYGLSYRLFEWMKDATKDVTVESTILLYSLAIWALTIFLMLLVHMVFGSAKIATVVEGRRSMLLAAARGLTFVVSHPTRILALYRAHGMPQAEPDRPL